jgi:hypothetical protein
MNTFKHIKLDHELALTALQWVDKYLTAGDSNGINTGAIDEYTISDGVATRAGTIQLNGVTGLAQYFIDGDRIIAPDIALQGSGFVGRYHYPSGKLLKTNEFSRPVAVVVSRS